MQNIVIKDIFDGFNDYLNKEQELREQIREVVREIDQAAKEATIALQIIHSSLTEVSSACVFARAQFEVCRKGYERLAELIPEGQYYRYNDHWHFLSQRIVFLVALTIYLEKGFLVSRSTAAEILGMKTKQADGFHLDIEDYLMGILQLASELSRYATNSVTLGDYDRPLAISKFVSDLNSGFRLLNLKNDGLRKRFDALKYDVKKIEEIVYDISIRGLRAEGTNSTPPQ
ncbi:translin [Toxorhynchites rutilus septentrionalis]|uniref:translin n=1 Tax=Toxorhynchites rutilus septentrionalis TaxID=329112 RepID=UPI00247A158F|nr:translin [Toxorhynchites rutilus septentrionalis]